MPFAARVTDPHDCPLLLGAPGPILPPCCLTVLIGMLPAARVTDLALCLVPPGDPIVKGSTSVMISYLPAARMGDMTAGGGVIAMGCPTVIIGG
jgi:uncharacterized Zn-binding protein involved in type VI secretion